MTPHALLHRVGEALYGKRWKTPLASDLGVVERTVRRWSTGEEKPRPGVWDDLWRLVVKRRDDLSAIADQMKEWGQ